MADKLTLGALAKGKFENWLTSTDCKISLTKRIAQDPKSIVTSPLAWAWNWAIKVRLQVRHVQDLMDFGIYWNPKSISGNLKTTVDFWNS